MRTTGLTATLTRLFAELVEGATDAAGGFVLNSGDIGLLRSLDRITAEDASLSANGGGSIASHARHVRDGLSLINRWAEEGGNPFADATWDEAWMAGPVDAVAWEQVRADLRREAQRWRRHLESPRDVSDVELAGMVASIAHVAYHLGAIRQIGVEARGPRRGTFD
jgi:hypothetical protein